MRLPRIVLMPEGPPMGAKRKKIEGMILIYADRDTAFKIMEKEKLVKETRRNILSANDIKVEEITHDFAGLVVYSTDLIDKKILKQAKARFFDEQACVDFRLKYLLSTDDWRPGLAKTVSDVAMMRIQCATYPATERLSLPETADKHILSTQEKKKILELIDNKTIKPLNSKKLIDYTINPGIYASMIRLRHKLDTDTWSLDYLGKKKSFEGYLRQERASLPISADIAEQILYHDDTEVIAEWTQERWHFKDKNDNIFETREAMSAHNSITYTKNCLWAQVMKLGQSTEKTLLELFS